MQYVRDAVDRNPAMSEVEADIPTGLEGVTYWF